MYDDKRKPTLSAARWALIAIFFIHGASFANWLARIPFVQAKLGLSEGQLGLALLGVSGGVIIGLLFAGGLIARWSSRRVTMLSGVLVSLGLIPIALATGFWTLFAALFVIGASLSVMDIAMNTQASAIEARYQRPMMSSFHAAFSIGGFVGALMGSGFAALSATVLVHFSVVGGLFALLMLGLALPLIEINGETTQDNAPAIQLPPREVWGLGVVVFAASIGEGAMGDWSALYLRDIVGTSESYAAWGFAAFSLMMTAGRLSGDWLADRYRLSTMVRLGGVIAAGGLFLALLVPAFIPTLLGFALVGAGVSVIIPLAFSRAGKLPDLPAGVGIAGVATIGYAGFLAGPPVIGLLADATSLRVALVLVAGLIASLVVTGNTLKRAE